MFSGTKLCLAIFNSMPGAKITGCSVYVEKLATKMVAMRLLDVAT